MGESMSREQALLSATMAAGAPGAGLSTAIDMRAYAGGILKNDGTNIDACDICFAVSETETGTYTLLYDEDNVAVKISTVGANAAFARAMPKGIFGGFWVKLQMTTAGGQTPKNATAAQTFKILAKG